MQRGEERPLLPHRTPTEWDTEDLEGLGAPLVSGHILTKLITGHS